MDVKEWALKWIQGSIISYLKGSISFRMLLGRINRALNSYGIERAEILAIISAIQANPVYFPSLSQEDKASRLEPVRRAVAGD